MATAKCEICGAAFYVRPSTLAAGQGRFCSKPCKGVWQSQELRSTGHGRAHGMYGTPTWKSWDGMKQRITNPRSKDYARYGGRGLDMDPRWAAFAQFLADMGERPSRAHSIGRKDNDLGYWPWNCRWETAREQNNNRRSCVKITALGETLSLAQWARRLGVPRQTIRYRYLAGWTPEAIVSTPSRKFNRRRNHGHQDHSRQ